MKRAYPTGTIEQFFNTTRVSKPSINDVIPQPNNTLSIIRSATKKNVLRLSIPSISDIEPFTDAEMDEILQEILNGAEHVLNGDQDLVSFARIHRCVEMFCRMRSSSQLLDMLNVIIKKTIEKFVSSIPRGFNCEVLSQIISSFEANLSDFRKVFLYLDRMYIFSNHIQGNTSIIQYIHSKIRDEMTEELILTIAQQIVLKLNMYRCDQDDEVESLSIVIKFTKDIKIYNSSIEPSILLVSKEFFENISKELNLKQFVSWMEKSVSKEKSLSKLGLDDSTVSYISSMIEQICLKDNSEQLFSSSDFMMMMKNCDSDSLRALRRFYSSPSLLPIFLDKFTGYYSQKMKEIYEKPQNEWISSIIQFIESTEQTVSDIFEQDNEVMKATRVSISNTINKHSEAIAKHLSFYLSDDKPGIKTCIQIFNMLQTKEIFEISYSYLLGKKMMSFSTLDLNKEEKLVSKIKQQTGPDFTERLEGMLSDYKDSRNYMKVFNHQNDFNYQVMTLGKRYWVSMSIPTVEFPREIDLCNKAYVSLYTIRQPKRIIEFSSSLSTCYLTYQNTLCKMTGDQAIVLLAIQESPNNIEDIAKITKMNRDVVEDYITVMMKNEPKILHNDNGLFSINSDIGFNKQNYSFPTHNEVVAEKEKASMESNIAIVRENKLKSSMTKIIKEHRSLKISDLFNRIQKQLTFVPDQSQFTSVLNYLEQIGFIERVGTDGCRYHIPE